MRVPAWTWVPHLRDQHVSATEEVGLPAQTLAAHPAEFRDVVDLAGSSADRVWLGLGCAATCLKRMGCFSTAVVWTRTTVASRDKGQCLRIFRIRPRWQPATRKALEAKYRIPSQESRDQQVTAVPIAPNIKARSPHFQSIYLDILSSSTADPPVQNTGRSHIQDPDSKSYPISTANPNTT